MSKSKGHWNRPKSKVYDYNYDYQEGYYKPMVDYLGDKSTTKDAKPPGALTFAERVARDCPGCKAHHKPGEPHFHGHGHPEDDAAPPHRHRHPSPVAPSPVSSPLPDDGPVSAFSPRRPRSAPKEPLSPLPDDLDHHSPSFPSFKPRLCKVPGDYEEPWTSLLDDPDLKTPDILKKLKDNPLKGLGRKPGRSLDLDDVMEDLDSFPRRKRGTELAETRPAFDHQISLDHIGSIGGHAMAHSLSSDYEQTSSLRMRKRDVKMSASSESTKITSTY